MVEYPIVVSYTLVNVTIWEPKMVLTVRACPPLHSADEFPFEPVIVEHDAKVEVKVEVPTIELLVDRICDVILLIIAEVPTGVLFAEMTWKIVAQCTSSIASNIAENLRHPTCQ